MNKIFDIQLLIKYRTQLMGFAMIWVIIYHFGMGNINVPIINFIGKSGYGGVDLFLFLSGMGIYFSIFKENNLKKFYFKRLVRIFPYYIPIVVIMGIIKNYSLGSILLNITTLSFWINAPFQFDWYIPALIFFYLVTPFYYFIFKQKPLLVTVLVIIISIVLSVVIDPCKLLITRIPVYLSGFYIGYLINNHKLLPKQISTKVLFILCGVVGVLWLYYNIFYLEYSYLWETGLWWYPFILITFPLLSLLSFILNLFRKYKFPVLTFMGKYSLVLYLLHWNILPLMSGHNKALACLMALILTVILGYIYQNTIEKIINKTLGK